jgi:hypothetical protein
MEEKKKPKWKFENKTLCIECNKTIPVNNNGEIRGHGGWKDIPGTNLSRYVSCDGSRKPVTI